MIDGVFVGSSDICNIHPTQIDKIEILKGNSAAIFGSRAMTGIIAVYLKEADVKWEYVPVGIEKIKPSGYYRSREFYSPNYDLPDEQFTGADYRNTLFWTPFVTTGKNGKTEISFFNSDNSADYEIQVEGVGLNGGIGQSKSSFVVDSE